MQAEGVNTSGLTPPLIEIQEALAELEAVKEARQPRPPSVPARSRGRKKVGG
jgi:hypothetical protein